MNKKNKLYSVSGTGIIVLMLCSALVGATPSLNINTQESNLLDNTPQPLNGYTHTVLVEAGTASWCPPCATAASVMHNLFSSGKYDFYYVALVADKNPFANARCAELGVSSIPDYVFDGGFTRHVGSGGIPNNYITRLDACGARVVSDIGLDLEIIWNGDATIDVNLDIINNENSAYNGHLHVYVTEIKSRWNTHSGQPYHCAMIGNYAFNQDVTTNAGQTTSLSTTWDGNSYGFSDIEEDNILVVATIFNKNNNLYVDQTTAESFSGLWPEEFELEISGGISAISALLKNVGTSTISDIDWSIYVNGGLLRLIDSYTEGNIESLAAGEETTIKTNQPLFGLGPISVSVTVNIGTKTANGFIIGPFIII
ncbi:MAG: thioredoxin family protein [Thermoplasmatota archaeon]